MSVSRILCTYTGEREQDQIRLSYEAVREGDMRRYLVVGFEI